MPTYDYQCTACGHAFEVFQRMSDEPVSNCSVCGAPARRRISGGSGFIFKGDGFYITDHRSQDYKDRAAADEGKAVPAGASGGDAGRSSSKRKDEAAPETSSASGAKASEADSGSSSSGSDAADGKKTGSEP